MATVLSPARHYLNDGYGIRSWLLTRDHKRIALLYLAGVTVFFFVGGAFAVLIRLELATPAGDLVTDDTYNKLFTMHGVMMVFFFLIPVIPSVLGNFLVPIMIGAKDLAFPKLNLLSWYIYIIGGLFTLYALISGVVDTGWTFYAPFSTVSSATRCCSTTSSGSTRTRPSTSWSCRRWASSASSWPRAAANPSSAIRSSPSRASRSR